MERAKSISPVDFLGAMRAAVDFEDVIVEVLDAQAQARHAQILDHLQLAFGERARLAFEGDFFGLVPGEQAASSRSTRRVSWFEEMKEGVPPPK